MATLFGSKNGVSGCFNWPDLLWQKVVACRGTIVPNWPNISRAWLRTTRKKGVDDRRREGQRSGDPVRFPKWTIPP